MGSLFSKHKELSSLQFRPFPTRPVQWLRVVRVGGTLIVGMGKTGELYTNGNISKKVAYLRGDWPFLPELLTALVRLGVVSKDVADDHKKDAEEVSKRRDAEWLLKRLPRELGAHGLKLTPGQMKKLKAATR